MNPNAWHTEPEEDRDLVESGAILAQNVALAVAVFCVCGFVATLIGIAT
jgi:hypothetical protein